MFKLPDLRLGCHEGSDILNRGLRVRLLRSWTLVRLVIATLPTEPNETIIHEVREFFFLTNTSRQTAVYITVLKNVRV